MNRTLDVTAQVSCIIPTHGRPEYLAEAIESVMNQTVPPREIIVVSDDDNIATENTVDALGKASSIPLLFLRRTDGPRGASASRNLGAQNASGSLFAFLDDDDVWEPDYLAQAVSLLSDEAVDAAVTPFYRFTSNGVVGETRPKPHLSAREAFVQSPGVTGSTLVITSAAFTSLSGYDESLPVMNDTDLFLRFLLAHHSYSVCDRPLVGVRKHGSGQLTDNSPRRVAGGWLFINKHRHRFDAATVRPRLYWQYRMLWRSAGSSATDRARALAGMALHYRPSERIGTHDRSDWKVNTRQDLREFMSADLVAQNAAGASWIRRQSKATLRFVRALRIAEFHNRPNASLASRAWRLVANHRLRKVSTLTGISIPPGSFGKGLGIPHHGSIVVHSAARFGEWCCVQNNVNIGAHAGGVPRGGDFIYIAPGAVIYGDVAIGTGSVIGANAVVRSDVTPRTTWAGAPARKVSDSDSSSLLVAAVAERMQARQREDGAVG
ncbi:glycosyltransferase [Brevibacterium sediminis]|uniref:glycosyltransferase n=1 Tax=Brevibacterium sediminis TaxID=1857024 RepID=UPI003B3ADD19